MQGHDFATIARRVRGSVASDGAGVKLTRAMQASASARTRARSAAGKLGVLGGGSRLALAAGGPGTRLIVVAGRPLREPVARHGPFVMNTRQELMQAFVDFQESRF
jgi:redox-sensitive bicupin YhaK (pirin superfamily)